MSKEYFNKFLLGDNTRDEYGIKKKHANEKNQVYFEVFNYHNYQGISGLCNQDKISITGISFTNGQMEYSNISKRCALHMKPIFRHHYMVLFYFRGLMIIIKWYVLQ